MQRTQSMLLALIILAVCCFVAQAQTPSSNITTAPPAATTSTTPVPLSSLPLPTDAIFIGAGFNSSLPDQRPVCSAAWLHLVSGNVYMFARYDILGVTRKPYSMQTVVTAGACEILHRIGR